MSMIRSRGEPPRGASRRDPCSCALQVGLPLQVRLQAVACPLLLPGHPHEVASGFFELSFRNLSGRGRPLVDPCLPFLRQRYKLIVVKGFCGGLLLCTCWKLCSMRGESHYVVCNPATQEWTVLPPLVFPAQDFSHLLCPIPYLGFDAAVPSHFVVFAPIRNGPNDTGNVAIYSSETRQWTCVQSKWASGTCIGYAKKRHVFLNGTMHFTTLQKSIVTVDMEGKVWREIEMPDDLPSNTDTVSNWAVSGTLVCVADR